MNANVNTANKNGSTPLFMASQSGHLDIVKQFAVGKGVTHHYLLSK